MQEQDIKVSEPRRLSVDEVFNIIIDNIATLNLSGEENWEKARQALSMIRTLRAAVYDQESKSEEPEQ